MSTKLENLPVELFGTLSELLLANELCWLWLSGSKHLHHLLEHGVTCFYHRPAQRRAYLWPSFISRFKRLQTVSIASGSLWNSSQFFHNIVLADIPASITSLNLNFANGLLPLLQPPSTGIISDDTQFPLMPLSIMFPNLAHLNVQSMIDTSQSEKKRMIIWDSILALPLSTFHLSSGFPIPASLLKCFSPTISSLKFTLMTGEADSFPPHLTDLFLADFWGNLDIAVLPRTLRRFTLVCKPGAFVQYHNWPPELEILSINHYGVSFTHSHTKMLPKTLLSLRIAVKSMELACMQDLPPNLTFLVINAPTAFSAVSQDEWSQFEPKLLPSGLVDMVTTHFIQHTPQERLNTYPTGIRIPLDTTNQSSENFVAFASSIADRVDNLSWRCAEPEIGWSFKNLRILHFAEPVHPGQIYFTLPLLPLLEKLTIARYIEDPSLALNRIVSPFMDSLYVNCHPLSLCKWDSRWLLQLKILNIGFYSRETPKTGWLDLLPSTGFNLDESARNDILAMDDVDWNDWIRFGATATKQDGRKVHLINWRPYSALLPRSLTELDISDCDPMDSPSYGHLASECDWPPRLERFSSFLPHHLWSSLPQSLKTFASWSKCTDLVQFARDLEQVPKRTNYVSIRFIHSTTVSRTEDLPTFTKLLQERPHIVQLSMGFANEMKLQTLRKSPFTAAVEATFGITPPI